jgi:seryl-tRNA synthetase
MLDIKKIRQNPTEYIENFKLRGQSTEVLEKFLELDKNFRDIKKELDNLKHERNLLSEKINQAKKNNLPIEQLIAQSKEFAQKIQTKEEKIKEIEKQIEDIAYNLPNIVHHSVPIGKDEKENKEIKKVFEPKLYKKDVLPHYEIGKIFGLDFERGAKLAGSRFTVLFNYLAKLERALAWFMLDIAIKNGYKEVLPPYLVNTKTMIGTGQLPKFKEELYKIEDLDLWLIPTAEVPLINLHSNEILKINDLPICYTALTPCFRKEAGNYQKDIKGIIRQHQFNKVEIVRFTHPQKSFEELELLTSHAAEVLEKLKLPYRIVELCSGDLGFSSAKTYDIEVWIPSQERYREISSCSNCTDFQARRANIRFRNEKNELEYVHTLNGSALAIGRTVVAILENYQKEDGIIIPSALVPYMGIKEITKDLIN